MKPLAGKMNTWADSMGVSLAHQPAPAKYHSPAAPIAPQPVTPS
ncbi:hypothetical protein [Novipirellula artificiosorum]|nr:hypothetical protein [Novipirellula artificiosorum]